MKASPPDINMKSISYFKGGQPTVYQHQLTSSDCFSVRIILKRIEIRLAHDYDGLVLLKNVLTETE